MRKDLIIILLFIIATQGENMLVVRIMLVAGMVIYAIKIAMKMYARHMLKKNKGMKDGGGEE